MTTLFNILDAAIDALDYNMLTERAALERELTLTYIHEYADSGMGIELSEDQARRTLNVGHEWLKNINEGTGEWSRMADDARAQLSEKVA